MTQICIIGNSHMGILENAFSMLREEIEAQLGPCTLTTFGMPGRSLRNCTVNENQVFGWHHDNRLEHSEPDTVAAQLEKHSGASDIDLSGADIVIAAGFFSPDAWLLGMMGAASIAGISECDLAGPRLPNSSLVHFVNMLDRTMSKLDHLRNISAPYRFALGGPAYSADALDDSAAPFRSALFRSIAASPAAAQHVMQDSNERLFDHYTSLGIHYLAQPAETKTQTVFSDPAFMRRSSADVPQKDYQHGNANMGKAYWQEILTHVAASHPKARTQNALGS